MNLDIPEGAPIEADEDEEDWERHGNDELGIDEYYQQFRKKQRKITDAARQKDKEIIEETWKEREYRRKCLRDAFTTVPTPYNRQLLYGNVQQKVSKKKRSTSLVVPPKQRADHHSLCL